MSTRVFFTVDNKRGSTEIFETLQEAIKFLGKRKGVIRIAIVKHAYREADSGVWNYDDYSDTFDFIHILS